MKVHGSVNVLNEINVARRANEGSISYAINNEDYIVSTNSHRWHFVTSNSSVNRVCLPATDSINLGWQITFIVSNTSLNPLLIADSGSNLLFTVEKGRTVTVLLVNKDTSLGTWKLITQDHVDQTLRNVVLTAATSDLLQAADNEVQVLPFVSTIANGFVTGPNGELTGIPNDRLVHFDPQTPYLLNKPLSFPATQYIYHTINNEIYISACEQDGGTEFPESPTSGYMFFNKSLGCNYTYLNDQWERFPSVVIGKVDWTDATTFECETYPFNFWLWDTIEFNSAFPDQTNNETKVLSTDGSNPYWSNTHILIDSVADTPPSEPTVGTVYYNTNTKKLYTYLSDGQWGNEQTPQANRIYVATSTSSFYAWVVDDLLTVGTGGVTASITYWEDVDVYQVSSGADLAYTRSEGTQGSYVAAGVSLYSDPNLNMFKEVAAANTWTYTGIVS